MGTKEWMCQLKTRKSVRCFALGTRWSPCFLSFLRFVWRVLWMCRVLSTFDRNSYSSLEFGYCVCTRNSISHRCSTWEIDERRGGRGNGQKRTRWTAGRGNRWCSFIFNKTVVLDQVLTSRPVLFLSCDEERNNFCKTPQVSQMLLVLRWQ